MSRSLFSPANHRDGAILYSGSDDRPHAHMQELLQDFPIELQRARQMRSWVFDPLKYAPPMQGATTQPMFGDGVKMGSFTTGDVNLPASGVDKDGNFNLVTAGNANDVVNLIAPHGFGPAAGTTLKCYQKLRFDDVDACDFLCGLIHDPSTSTANSPPDFLVSTTGVPGDDFVDGLIFHREDGDALTSIKFSVYDGASNTNSTATITLPAAITDLGWIEFGITCYGLTEIHALVRVAGQAPVKVKYVKSASVMALLTSSLLKMGWGFAMRSAGAAGRTVQSRAGGVIQTYA